MAEAPADVAVGVFFGPSIVATSEKRVAGRTSIAMRRRYPGAETARLRPSAAGPAPPHRGLVERLAQPVVEPAQHRRVGDVVVVVHAVRRVAESVGEGQDPGLDAGQRRGVSGCLAHQPLRQHLVVVAGVDHEPRAREDLAQPRDVLLDVVAVPADLLEPGDPGVGLGRSTVSPRGRGCGDERCSGKSAAPKNGWVRCRSSARLPLPAALGQRCGGRRRGGAGRPSSRRGPGSPGCC